MPLTEPLTALGARNGWVMGCRIGITGGDHNSELGIVGVDEQLLQWSDTHGIQILDGGIFWMNPTQSTVNLQVIEEEGPAMVGQLTVPLGYRGVAAMGMAGDGVDGHSWRYALPSYLHTACCLQGGVSMINIYIIVYSHPAL